MKTKTQKYISDNIINDIEQMADDVSVLFDMENEGAGTPKEQIDEFISFAKENGIDFWAIVKSNCSSYEKQRLEHIYEGKDLYELDRITFGEKEVKPFQEFFPERAGIILISFIQAKKLKEMVGDFEAEHYYVASEGWLESPASDNGRSAMLATKKQMTFMKEKEGNKYTFYAAIPKNQMIDL